MSGSGVCRLGSDSKLYLFGAVQEVPANFSEGLLEVARVSHAFEDAQFRSQLEAALGAAPVLAAFQTDRMRADLGIARIFQTRTRAFTDEYLVSETGPVPFGGRDAELRRLDSWLFDPQGSPRMLVTAPAGRGKSALLVRWMKNLQDGGVCGVDGWQLAFMPISIRTGTNRPEVFYESLARRLSEITTEPLAEGGFRNSDGFRYAVRDQLDRLASTVKLRVLVVIDGIDEALGDSFNAGVFPTTMPTNLRILLSARWQVGDHNSDGWLERLGWGLGVKVETFELDRLSERQIADVLIKLGAPVDILTREPGLVHRLADLTEGEPLVVRYYAEDLWNESCKGARISRAELELLKPGFDSYFKRWLGLQQKLWKEEGAQIDPNQVDAILSILAFALGPLSERDMLALLKRIHGLTRVTALDRLLDPLRRWVFGGGQRDYGYVLSHPRIGQFLQRNRFAANADEIRQGFSDWGKAQAADLNEGKLRPEQASSCCLQFLPAYMKQAKAPVEDFMVMVENGWRLAWEKLEGGQRGFASAVRAAFEAIKQDDKGVRFGARWRCALTLSSIESLSENVPIELLLVAAEKGALTIRQAGHFAILKRPSRDSVQLIARLALLGARDSQLSSELWSSALEFVKEIDDDDGRAETLAALAEHLPADLLPDVVNIAKAIGDDGARATALAALAPNLPAEQTNDLLLATLTAAKAVEDELDRARILVDLAPRISAELFSDVLAAATAIKNEGIRAKALAGLAAHLTAELFPRALAAAEAIRKDRNRAKVLVEFAAYLPTGLLSDVLAATKAIDNNHRRAEVLTAIAPRLSVKQRKEALSDALRAVNAIDDEYQRATALAAVAPLLPAKQANKALHKAFVAAKTIGDDENRADALIALAPHLPVELLSDAIAETENFDEQYEGAMALAALAPRLPAELLADALAAAKSFYSSYALAKGLAALAPFLPPELLSDAVACAEAMRDGGIRAETLAKLAGHLPAGQAKKALADALVAASAIPDNGLRLGVLANLAPHLPADLLSDAIIMAKAIRDKPSIAMTLTTLAAHLPAELIYNIYSVIKVVPSDHDRADCLAALAPHLPTELLSDALAAANAIEDDTERAEVLTALAPRLPTGQRKEAVSDALNAAEKIDDAHAQADAFKVLASQLPTELLLKALVNAFAIRRVYNRKDALVALAARLPAEFFSDALDAAKAIGDERDRADCLAALAPHLPTELLSDALAAANAVEDDTERAEVLTALAPRLPAAQRKEAASDALNASRAMVIEEERARVLATLAPHLPTELLSDALAAANAIEDDTERAGVLTALAPRLPTELFSNALAAARKIRDMHTRADALAAIALHLPNEQANKVFSDALGSAKAIGSKSDRAVALATLAQHLPAGQREATLSDALAAARAISSHWARAGALSRLAPHLLVPAEKKEVLSEALAAAKAVGYDDVRGDHARAQALTELAQYLPAAQAKEAIIEIIASCANIVRPKALEAVAKTVSIAKQFDEQNIAEELYKTINDISVWYP